jgi:uncharacterized membrane protein HdeD (DUF308 family)
MFIGIVVICMGIFSLLHVFNLMVSKKENFKLLGLVVGMSNAKWWNGFRMIRI